jgi:hypothetical protein
VPEIKQRLDHAEADVPRPADHDDPHRSILPSRFRAADPRPAELPLSSLSMNQW